MAARLQTTLNILMTFILLSLTQPFEVRDDQWEELSPDIAALHRLRGLSQHMVQEPLRTPSNQRAMPIYGARALTASRRLDDVQNPKSWQDNLRRCDNFTACVIRVEQDFDGFLADIDKQKVQDWLLRASMISHSYSQKLLVMIDKENSTVDRVQQEYSMDPHYSVIVSKECLHNESCVPEADDYTVVKIFGSVSGDGQTVSGLSGSSLAELVLKPSLEAAPVFSVDGNTTADFKHNFIRVFVVNSIQTVLETNQDKQQIYQVMDQTESISSYQIPQRQADHSTQYDHQHILMMEDDPVVKKAAENLFEKHPTVSSVYYLDENQKLKLIHGEAVPLSENSRLVLVGHGGPDDSGEMRLAKYRSKEVAKAIEKTSRLSNKIKTISVVGCEVGSDKEFVKTLLTELHEAGIETELHLKDAVVQVRHTGEKITQEISADGLKWRHKDDSTKVVATVDRNGEVIFRNEPGSKGEAIFTNERNSLGKTTRYQHNRREKSRDYHGVSKRGGIRKAKERYRKPGRQDKTARERFLKYRDSWPEEPKRFITRKVFRKFPQNKVNQIEYASDELEGLAWGLFHSDQPFQEPEKITVNKPEQLEEYVIRERETNKYEKTEWIKDKSKLKEILNKCYDIKSGKDVTNVIRHYAKKGEDDPTYLKVNDWIYYVDPFSLYVYPVGKKLGETDKIHEIKDSITEQIDNEKYPDIRKNILRENKYNPEEVRNNKKSYAKYASDIFHGKRPTGLRSSTEAWFTTYFTASVISESARNFRTLPLVLMALEMVQSKDSNIQDKGLNFLFEEHSMAQGETWIDPSRRGFSGSATPKDSSKLENKHVNTRRSEEQLMNSLSKLVTRESDMFTNWQKTLGGKNVKDQMAEMVAQYKLFEDSADIEMSFKKNYRKFEKITEQQQSTLTPSGRDEEPSASGALGGYEDGSVTMRDLNSASELENTFKHESYFSRASASFAEEVHSQLKAKYGEKNLADLHPLEGTARIENGQFVCQLASSSTDAEPVEFRAELSAESQHYYEKTLKNLDAAVQELEIHSSQPSHEVSKYVEHTGTAVGAMGLMLGMKGAVRAFEQGDIKDGVVGTLQTAHGVAGMTMPVIAREALSSETRIAKAATTVMRSPAMKGVMTVIPLAGIGFGVYNLVEDFKRGDTLGYIDAALDGTMIALDVLELAQPELAPFIAPINMALSIVRMIVDDVYMEVQNELNSLPKDAGVLDKLGAVIVGVAKGILHFAIHVASFFYDWRYDEIEEGRRLVEQISDYHKYYTVTKEQDGTTAVDFSGGASSWNGGGISFCLADQGPSQFCMDDFVSSDESLGKRCWDIDTQGSKDIILGLGESHQLEYKTLEKKVLMFIPAGSVTVVSGYEAISDSRYGTYKGNRESNRFFAAQKAQDQHSIEVMLSYYYTLYGEPGDDIFFLGPQRSYVEGSGGKDTYIVPKNGGKTTINNYDPSKASDTLHFSVEYSDISVSKSGDDVVLRYQGSHTVIIQNWFLGELYRHVNMVSGDGVLFEISATVLSSVQLVARGINKMFMAHGETVNASQPLLRTVTNIFGSQYDDVLIGNGENNLIDGGGGRDRLIGREGEDIYMVKNKQQSSVSIENYATDNKTDLAIIEANLHTFEVSVEGDNLNLKALHDNTALPVILLNWFRSSEDQHLLVLTKDLITFSISGNKADCLLRDVFTKCIKSQSIDYSSSPSALVVDLQEDEAFDSVTEVRGSQFDDVVKGNKEHNVVVPGKGNDYIEGRGGEDWYVITPGQGVKTINNKSPDLTLDTLFFKEQYQHIKCTCERQSIIILVEGRQAVILQNWFVSKNYQHMQIKTNDGVTAGLSSNISSCTDSLIFPLTVDYRNQTPEPLQSAETHLRKRSTHGQERPGCYSYRNNHAEDEVLCGQQGKVMMMNNIDSVKDMYGSAGFDVMVGNSNENVLDPYTGGALMFGGEGKDTYIIKHGYGSNLMIDNFAEDNSTDTVLVDMDFLDGSQVQLDSSAEDLNVTIVTKKERFTFRLLSYSLGSQHQHLDFQSSDGVHFKLKSQNSTGEVPVIQIEAFKVTLKQSQDDCHLDLSAHRNLSKVQTVQGCPSQSNNILSNNRDSVLFGGWKDDILEGGEGDDTLIGGNGTDILIGGTGDDTLYGEDGNDTLMGNSGWDIFIPGPGADLVDGGPGRDTVLYRGDPEKGQGVYVNLLTGQGRYADAEGDVLTDVETVVGTIYSDILVAGYESSLLKGSDGNDILVSTGEDYLVGGDGNDVYMLAFDQGSTTIDNCAKDNATDVLYMSSKSLPIFDCQHLPDRVLLTFYGLNRTRLRIGLKGWISDDHECGHLVLVFREVEASVDRLLQDCEFRLKESVWSLTIMWVICIGLVLFHCVFALQMSRKYVKEARQQNTRKETETNVVAESTSLVAEVI